jgi:hypothetical protein
MDRPKVVDGTYVFELEGCVAALEAWRVHDAVRALPPRTRVVVDLRKAVRVEDAAVAVLARSLARAEPPVEVRGLGAHHRRILQYLGLAFWKARTGTT